MIQVRSEVFETNSSSTHAITMCTEEDFNKLKNSGLFFNSGKKEFELKTEEEMFDIISESYGDEVVDRLKACRDGNFEEDEDFDEEQDYFDLLSEYEWYTWESYKAYSRSCGYSSYNKKFTTPSGESVVAFGYYGNAY